MKHAQRTERGFTLIETVVYLALFSVIIGGAIVSGYQIVESSGRNQTHSMIQEEGDFLMAKIDWTLSGVQVVTTPPVPALGNSCTTDTQLSVTKWDAAVGNPVVIAMAGTDLIIGRGGNPAVILNNSNTTISNLTFTHCYTGGVNPESVKASLTVTARTPNGSVLSQDFFTTSYVRK